MRWASRVAVLLLLLVIGAAAIGALAHLSQTEPVALPPPAPVEAMRLPPPAVGSEWRYTAPQAYGAAQAGDEACTRSQADLDIGGRAKSLATLCLRRGGGYPYAGSIVLLDRRGQFACAGCAIRARFDGGKAESFGGTAASADSADYALFILDGARLAGELKRSSTVTFDVTVRGAGAQQVTFNVGGLRWGQ
jgi:hypothetical protein